MEETGDTNISKTQKTNQEMAISSFLSVVTSGMNGLNSPVGRHGWQNGFEKPETVVVEIKNVSGVPPQFLAQSS